MSFADVGIAQLLITGEVYLRCLFDDVRCLRGCSVHQGVRLLDGIET